MNVGHDTQRAAELAATVTGAQATLTFQLGPKETAVYQADFDSTGSFVIEGRLGPEAPWVALTAAITTTSTGVVTPAMPQMRVNVSANATGLDVWLKA